MSTVFVELKKVFQHQQQQQQQQQQQISRSYDRVSEASWSKNVPLKLFLSFVYMLKLMIVHFCLTV